MLEGNVHQGVAGVHLLYVFPLFIKHNDLVDTEHDAGAGNLSGQVRAELRGLSVIQDRPGQSHTHCVGAT